MALRVMRESPCEEPSACGGEKRSMPSTRTPRRASSQAAAPPAAPSPTTMASKDARGTSFPVGVAVLRGRLELRRRRELALHRGLHPVAEGEHHDGRDYRDARELELARAARHAEGGRHPDGG